MRSLPALISFFTRAEREETISPGPGQDKVEKFCAVVDLKGKLVIVRKELSDKETYLLQGKIAEKGNSVLEALFW